MLATFRTWLLSERLSRSFTVCCDIRYSPIGASSNALYVVFQETISPPPSYAQEHRGHRFPFDPLVHCYADSLYIGRKLFPKLCATSGLPLACMLVLAYAGYRSAIYSVVSSRDKRCPLRG
jgi:hypothetical protein